MGTVQETFVRIVATGGLDTAFLEIFACASARARQALFVDLYPGAVQIDGGTTIPGDILQGWFHTHDGTLVQSVVGF